MESKLVLGLWYIDYILFFIARHTHKGTRDRGTWQCAWNSILIIGKDEDYDTLHDTYFAIAESNLLPYMLKGRFRIKK